MNRSETGKNDECYTPEYGVTPLLEFINPQWTVWCPCDTAQSAFVRLLTAHGCKVIHSHIANGQDFLTYAPYEAFDAIITNPPFTRKRLFVERALSFGVPVALLMPTDVFRDKYPIDCFRNAGAPLGVLWFPQRIEFIQQNPKKQGKVNFSSCYLTSGILPEAFMTLDLTKKPLIISNLS
jgi:hypothetical protein